MAQLCKNHLLSAENIICIEEEVRTMCSFCEFSGYGDVPQEYCVGIRYRSQFLYCQKNISNVELSRCSGFELAEDLKTQDR